MTLVKSTKVEKASGIKSFSGFIGKTDYDLWPQYADDLVKHDQEVMRTGRPLYTEEIIIHTQTKEIRYYAVAKTPLRDGDGKIIGVLGNSIDITDQKKGTLHYLESIAPSLPGPIYWKDKNSVYLGMNSFALEVAGIKSIADFIGKTDYDLWPQFADDLVKHDQEVMQTGMAVNKEETIAQPNGTIKYFTVIKTPLRDDEGNIIGIIGNSIDITAIKEAEILRLKNEKLEFENKAHQVATQEQDKFRKIVGQILHDIRSPLSTLDSIAVEQSNNLAENSRISLRNAANRINDIANNLLTRYQNKDTTENETQGMLVSLALLQILSEKRYEYQNTQVTFETDFEQATNFIFIKINPADFKRMISNLINNAVEAVKDKPNGTVTLRLTNDISTMSVIIMDNGSGMPKHIIDKFNAGIAITEGKEGGHGIGLTQVRDTIAAHDGICKISAIEGASTKFIMHFPKIPALQWLASEIKLTQDDTIVIVDDDESIHGAWDGRLSSIVNEFPTFTVRHFTQGQEAIDYLNSLSMEQKQDTFLLTDYELLNQGITGLDVIKRSNMHRALLVTSHISNPKLQDMVMQAGVRAIPKELTPVIPITVNKKMAKGGKKVDIVWVEDQKWWVEDLIREHYSHLAIDIYTDPDSLMQEVYQYPLDTRFIIDSTYIAIDDTEYRNGYILAYRLHEMGYTKLIVFSGEAASSSQVPDWLTIVMKADLEKRKILHTL